MATGTKTEVDDEVEVKPSAKADPGLAKMFQAHELLKEKTGKSFSAIIDYVEKHDLSAEVIRLTLMESRGLTEGSARSEASRIRNLLKPKYAEVREKLNAGEITVQAARTQTSKRQDAPAKSPADLVQERLLSAARRAIIEPGYFAGIADFIEATKEAWNTAKAEVALKNKKKDQDKANGDEDEGETEEESEEVAE
jgi:hypothetical protein